jgi:hypothetical protein
MRAVALFLVALAVCLSATLFSPAAHAAARIALSSASGSPVVLTPREGGLAGDFTIANVGDAPLVVSRIAIRGDADDVRSPPHVTVRFDEGALTSATIAPGERRVATVRFMPDRSPRMSQAFGHVVVTSTDEAAGEVAIGFRGALPSALGPIGDHTLSLVIAAPFLGALMALALGTSRRARVVAVVVGVVECALVAWMLHRFVAGVTTADGNDGLQLIEHAVWVRPIGVEWFVGLDGANVAAAALVALIGLSGALASHPARSPAYHAVYLVLVGALLGAVLSFDLFVVFAFVEIVVAAAARAAASRRRSSPSSDGSGARCSSSASWPSWRTATGRSSSTARRCGTRRRFRISGASRSPRSAPPCSGSRSSRSRTARSSSPLRSCSPRSRSTWRASMRAATRPRPSRRCSPARSQRS